MNGLPRRSMLLAIAGLPWCAQAQPAELGIELRNARLLGRGRLSFFGLDVYDARLWVADGFEADDFIRHPVALELEYARSLVGAQIAQRSLAEMKKVGDMPEDKAGPWLAAMTQIFPDVNRGDRITGLFQPAAGMRFFVNGKARGDVRDIAFARLFVGIWLSPRTSEPKLRQALLGAG